ncbi:MAG: hypothetical protein EZS28_015072 [Streblomastix strix]|uniref:Uncharacterized protein n=1 Tax=Streblomastix strix TaxID=222440 RepID=A0A5J4W4K5_9EUKA|nr:MAG: hypothetical protein EZS28_015072 [Streblomastix strix]
MEEKSPQILSPILILPAVLKKIREEQIEALIIAPRLPGQIWYQELLNGIAQSLMFGCSSEILEPGTSLIKKNLKLPPGKTCCLLMDRKLGKEQDSQERFQEYQINPGEQQIQFFQNISKILGNLRQNRQGRLVTATDNKVWIPLKQTFKDWRSNYIYLKATFFDWLNRIDNKQGPSIRDDKYGALL